MGEVMTGAIVTERLTVAVQTALLLGVRYIPMGEGPAKILVAVRSLTDDDRRLNQDVTAAPNNGNRMAQVALGADRLLVALRIGINVLIVMAAETAQCRGVLLVVRIGFPIQVHIWEVRRRV